MIKKPPLLAINTDFVRPTTAVVKALDGAATGQVVDALGGRSALDWSIKPLPGCPTSFCGSALTVHAGPGDCLAVFAALREARPGDVLVVSTDNYREAAATGDILVAVAKKVGVVAFVTDGLVRDIPGMVAQGLPCFCAGVTPNSAHRTGPGSVGHPIIMGNVTIASGDVVVGDQDGVVVVPKSAHSTIAQRLEDVRQAERSVEDAVQRATGLPPFITDALAGAGF